MTDPADAPAALVATRIVRADDEDAFAAWADTVAEVAARQRGHRATLRLEQAGGLVHLVQLFDDADSRARAEAAPEWCAVMERGGRFDAERRQHAQGRAMHLILPSESAASKPRTFVVTWITAFPVLLALSTGARALLGDLPQPVQLLFTSLVMVGLLTFVILPRVSRALRPWTLADGEGRARKEPG